MKLRLEEPGSLRSQVWRTLVRLQQGPPMMTVDIPDSDRRVDFYGWPVLRLESLKAHQTGGDDRETRIVFANWGWKQMATPPRAVLRAVSGDQQLARNVAAVLEQSHDSMPFEVPARFVWLSINDVKQWVAMFERLVVPIGDPSERSDPQSIRTLRIDLGRTTQIMEKRWQSRNEMHAMLNQRWGVVWYNMTAALSRGPVIDNLRSIHESASWLRERDLFPFRYTSDLYDPERHRI